MEQISYVNDRAFQVLRHPPKKPNHSCEAEAMYCSRRAREVPRPTDTCARCGRCNWEQDDRRAEGRAPVTALLTGAAIVIAAILLFIR